MTRDELRAEVRRLTRRLPAVPVRITSRDGRQVVVDVPTQVSDWTDGVAVELPGGRKVLVAADAVDRVEGFDELPPEAGGMGYGQFYAAVRPLFHARPFRPFEVGLTDGRRLDVRVQGLLTLAGRWGSFMPLDGPGMVRFTVDQVAAVRPLAEVARC